VGPAFARSRSDARRGPPSSQRDLSAVSSQCLHHDSPASPPLPYLPRSTHRAPNLPSRTPAKICVAYRPRMSYPAVRSVPVSVESTGFRSEPVSVDPAGFQSAPMDSVLLRPSPSRFLLIWFTPVPPPPHGSDPAYRFLCSGRGTSQASIGSASTEDSALASMSLYDTNTFFLLYSKKLLLHSVEHLPWYLCVGL
jgi:hypothetical protein